jgi:AraC-like DNA-binding protein
MHQDQRAHSVPPLTATGALSRCVFVDARNKGVDLRPALKRAGLTVQQIENPKIRLDASAQVMFVQLAAETIGDDLLGFHLAQSFDLREFGLLHYVLASSETLGAALQRAERFVSITNEGIVLECLRCDELAFRADYFGLTRHSDRQQMEFMMTALVRVFRQLTNRDVSPTRVCFAHLRSRGVGEFDRYFCCTTKFGARTDEVVLPPFARELPIVSADPYLSDILIQHAEVALALRSARPSVLRSNVENAITPLLPHDEARIAAVARKLGISTRTLARRLAAEGLSFGGILDDLRSALALRYLEQADLSISQIAWLLGYQEVSSFTHAVKRWTHRTPRQLRNRSTMM